ncbi:hypothetical protein J1N35_007192 [Gossypium stocksii]|uniref:Reverse transcriptase domain-containing protein n=1 Tax=Gossypium stocksii TaxID=47602 RepID=A0A9D3W5K6_9ROSI|nr:hypothetical protein J1N35_007192 [Gossypium stocksii]
MRSRKVGKNWMAIKLDLEKAYDRISIDFIDMSLIAARILEFLRKVGVGLISFFFADDLVIFSEEELEQAFFSKEILKHFCDFSRHKISAMKSNMYFSKGDSSTIRDWKDSWVLDIGPIFSYVLAYASLDLESTLRDWVLLDGSWNVDLLHIWLLDNMIKCILSIPPHYFAGGEDRTIWA